MVKFMGLEFRAVFQLAESSVVRFADQSSIDAAAVGGSSDFEP